MGKYKVMEFNDFMRVGITKEGYNYGAYGEQFETELKENGFAWYDAYQAKRKTVIISSTFLKLPVKKHAEYLYSTLIKLLNGEITLEDIDREYQPYEEIKKKREAATKAKEEAERLERQREIERKLQELLRQAANDLGRIELGFQGKELDNFVQYIFDEVENGTYRSVDIIKLAKTAREDRAQQRLEAEKEERKKQAEAKRKELQAEQDKEKQKEKEYHALAAKGQFLFDNLLIQRQKNSTSFLLPNENNKKITAYGIIERLTGDKFKSYRKQIKIKNNKIQILPFSERIRLIFYFRQQYRTPPLLDNADTVAAFLHTASKYTSNIQLNQNWSACLNVTNTQEEAASLLAYYGWAADFAEEYPHTENAFYTVDVRSGTRHYNIVHDDIALRFMAIERKGRSLEAHEIISNKEMQYQEKYNALQELLKPLLWWSNGIKMGLTREAREQCEERVSEYINNLFEHNAFDCIPLDEHINRVKIDKSETGIVWAEPRQFSISMDDMEFLDYQYNINAEYNKANAAELGAARSEKAAQRNMEKVIGNIGDILSTKELYAMGVDKDKLSRLIKQGKIERTKRGYYRIISR